MEKTLTFGPKRKGPNILINKYLKKDESFFQKINQMAEKYIGSIAEIVDEKKAERRQKEDEERFQQIQEILTSHDVTWRDMCNSFITGFDIAVQSGPLCEEPILGAVFLIESIKQLKKAPKPTVATSSEFEVIEEEKGQSDSYGSFAGQVIATVKDICKRAFLNAEPRLVEGVYLVSMHATPDAYGKIYGVINKCRGRVVKEEVQDGTNNFLIDALIPLIEGFVFNEEIRSKSCGIAYPQLVFAGFQILEDDPFFIPQTEEELEDHGLGDILPPNPAKLIIEKVRTRKGLPIDKKIVVAAEQQRTLSKKK